MSRYAPLFHRAALLVAATALLSACDAMESLLPGDDDEGGNPPSSHSLARFNVEVAAQGSFRPGQPVQIAVTATALIPTEDAEIKLLLPEVASAQIRGGWQDFRPVVDRPLPPALSRRLSMGRNQRIQEHLTVTFPEPGVYTVWAGAYADEEASLDGNPVQNGEYRQIVLWIDEQGGRVTTEFDPSEIPGNARGLPGPRQVHAQTPARRRPERAPSPPGSQRPAALAARAASDPANASLAGNVEVQVQYINPQTNQYEPVRNAQWHVYMYDENNAQVEQYGGWTSPTGRISLSCAGPGVWGDLYVWANNYSVSVGTYSDYRVGTEIAYFDPHEDWGDCSGGVFTATAKADYSKVFNNMNLAMDAAFSKFGYARPKIPVVLVNETNIPYSSYCPSATYAACNNTDYIRVNTNTGSVYGQQVWTSNGVWIQAHELGHAYHEKALGGYIRYWASAGCAQVHPAGGLSDMRCSLPEGFADYFAVYTRGAETGYDFGVEISNDFLRVPGHPADGSRVQAAVASFLWDVTDSGGWDGQASSDGVVNEVHDVVGYSGRLVADAFRTCEAYQGGAWIFNRGIDHIIWCMERRVDPVVTASSTYFPTRSPDPTNQRATLGVTADPAQIRRLWLWNLYQRTTT